MILEYNGTFEGLAGLQEKYENTFISIFGLGGMVTPAIDENYWLFRVPVSEKQSIVCFPKFGTFGIGFQVESKDWNTNLPYQCDTEEIYNHIKINKCDKRISKKQCLAAIGMLQRACIKFNGG